MKDRRTEFVFNGQQFEPMDFSVGIGQGSSLSPILTGLYIAPAIHEVMPIYKEVLIKLLDGKEFRIKFDWTKQEIKANGHATVQFFVDDGLIHVGGKLSDTMLDDKDYEQLLYNNTLLKYLYEKLVDTLRKLALSVETDKLELMHFIRKRKDKTKEIWSDDDPLGPKLKVKDSDNVYTVKPKKSMRYLGFMLDPKLTFKEYVRKFITKGISTINTIRMLGNSSRGLKPIDKRRLYIANIIPVMTYGMHLWWRSQ